MNLSRDSAMLWLPIVGGLLVFLSGHFQLLQMAFPGLGPEWNARIELLSAFLAFAGAYARKSPLPLSPDSDLRGLKNPDQSLTMLGKLP